MICSVATAKGLASEGAAPPSFEGGDRAVGESFGGKRVPLSACGPTDLQDSYEIALDRVLTAVVVLRSRMKTGGQGWLYVPRREVLNA